jgi:hypothetical protein
MNTTPHSAKTRRILAAGRRAPQLRPRLRRDRARCQDQRPAEGCGSKAAKQPGSNARPKRPFRNWLSGMQLIEQRLRLLEIEVSNPSVNQP